MHTRAHLLSQTQLGFLLQVSHLGHVLTGCTEMTQLQFLWLAHHLTEELIVEEDGGVGERTEVCATLLPHRQLVERLIM